MIFYMKFYVCLVCTKNFKKVVCVEIFYYRKTQKEEIAKFKK